METIDKKFIVDNKQLTTSNKPRTTHNLMVTFRFQDLKIWQLAIEIANELFEIADTLPAANAGSLVERSSGQEHGSPRPSMPTDNKFPKIA